MDISPELGEKIQELQILERNSQTFSMEKQNFQIEANEIENALSELSKSEEVYKIINGLMIKSQKESLSKDLNERKKVLDIRINAIEKQEKSSQQKIDTLRAEINSKFVTKSSN